jgi:hypothetical protein
VRAHVPDPTAELVIGMTVEQAKELESFRLPDPAPHSLLLLRSTIRSALAEAERIGPTL